MGYKVRLVANGYTQKEGVYHNEIFTSVVRYTIISVMLAYYDRELEQFDVKLFFYMVTLMKRYS